MQKIIYSSPVKIDWDAQSAFKVTNYYTDEENHMVFCYLKQYVHNGDLKICTFCFEKEAEGQKDLWLCLNLNPTVTDRCVQLEFGIDGIEQVFITQDGACNAVTDSCGITYHSFRSNDQQGFYWCGELTLSKEFIKEHFDTLLEEKSIILLNFYRVFKDSGDYACLFPDNKNDILARADSMQEFVILKY